MPMNSTDSAFVQGMLKKASSIERQNEKQAYGARLTQLLQRKGKLPGEAKPTVGVSSFPKTANEELLNTLRQYLESGQHAVGQGVDKLKDFAYDGKQLTERAGASMGRGAIDLNSFLKDHPIGATAAGAGIGGAAGYLSGKSEDEATGQQGTRGRNALLGALLGGGLGAGAHGLAKSHGDALLLKARTAGKTPEADYSAPHQNQSLNLLKQLGIAPSNVGRNAPPSSLNVTPRF